MTTETRSATGQGIDYGRIESAIGLNWYDADPNLQAQRLTDYMADVAQAALLVEEAAWELEHKGSARKALVARHFANLRLSEHPVRGITSGDRTTIDFFEPTVRYQPVSKDAL